MTSLSAADAWWLVLAAFVACTLWLIAECVFAPLEPDERPEAICRCHHAESAHDHYRSGSNCSLCTSCHEFVDGAMHTAQTTMPPADVLTDCDPDWDWQFDRIVRGEI